VEPPFSHSDVTTIMRILSDISDDVEAIRVLLDDDGEEEEDPETDA
jgi:hypothetical protein